MGSLHRASAIVARYFTKIPAANVCVAADQRMLFTGCVQSVRLVSRVAMRCSLQTVKDQAVPALTSGSRRLHVSSRNNRFADTDGHLDEHDLDTVDIDELKNAIMKEVVLIDCRDVDEVEEYGLIPGANCIPVHVVAEAFALSDDDFKEQIGFTKPKADDEIILYCRSGLRAAKGCKVLQDAGFSRVKIFRGGWLEWSEKN